ncbi:hypothetical protein AAG906_010738 [Vitis piasezkii]
MVGASSSWSRALVQISPSTFSIIGIAIGIGVFVLGAACSSFDFVSSDLSFWCFSCDAYLDAQAIL